MTPGFAVNILAAVIIVFGLLYVIGTASLGQRATRRAGVPMSRQEAMIDAPVDQALPLYGFSFYFLVAGLNEEEVIGGTLAATLRDQAPSTVIVVDDGSDDRTAEIVDAFAGSGRVLRLTRTLPQARKGKGKALNHGMELVRADVAARGLDPDHVLVGVLDADGRLTPNATHHVAREFHADPALGGLQLVVRIRNRDSLVLAYQDLEFWAMSGLNQLGRVPIGTVSMGGNGQFTRLSALDEVGTEPWSESLTEDLDLGISLAVRGWKTTSTPYAYVTQQGVADLRRLLRQRTRWYQGHMTAIVRLPEMARSRYLPTGRFLELAAYLLIPWVLSLPWSVVSHYLLYETVTGHGLPDLVHVTWPVRVVLLASWYVVSFSPYLFWAYVYWRRSRSTSLWRSLLMVHLMLVWTYTGHIAGWRALGRIVLRRRSWTKTARHAEDSVAGHDRVAAGLAA